MAMDDVFKALSDPSRRKLLDRLFKRDGQTLSELCERIDMTRFGVMKHLRLLEEAGLVTTQKHGREKHHYLNPVPIRLIHDRWVSKFREPFTAALVQLKSELEAPMADKNSAQQGYLTSEPYTIARQGKFEPAVFLLADQGYPSYAAMVLAPRRLIETQPAAIRAFVEASAVGWKNYLSGDPGPADRLILKDNPEMTEDILAQARDKMRRYGLVDGGEARQLGVGTMTDAHWLAFFKVASSQGTANYKDAFTLDFLPNPPVK